MSYEKKERPLLAEGEFRARCIDAVLGETRNGDPQIVAVFEFRAGPNDGKHQPWWGGFKTPKQEEFTRKALIAMGWDESGLDASGLATLQRNDVMVTVRTRANNDGTPASEIAFVNEIGAGRLVKKRLDQRGVSDLERRLGCGGKTTAPSNGRAIADDEFGGPDDVYGGAPVDDDVGF
jgi:hypothetical protein